MGGTGDEALFGSGVGDAFGTAGRGVTDGTVCCVGLRLEGAALIGWVLGDTDLGGGSVTALGATGSGFPISGGCEVASGAASSVVFTVDRRCVGGEGD